MKVIALVSRKLLIRRKSVSRFTTYFIFLNSLFTRSDLFNNVWKNISLRSINIFLCCFFLFIIDFLFTIWTSALFSSIFHSHLFLSKVYFSLLTLLYKMRLLHQFFAAKTTSAIPYDVLPMFFYGRVAFLAPTHTNCTGGRVTGFGPRSEKARLRHSVNRLQRNKKIRK